MASGWILPPSHFSTSLYQFLTRLEGDTTTAFSISGLQSGLCRRSVHMSVMHWRVLPSPISSAMMQPWLPGIRRLVTHSQRNFTPCQKILLSEHNGNISTVTTSLPQRTGLIAQQICVAHTSLGTCSVLMRQREITRGTAKMLPHLE